MRRTVLEKNTRCNDFATIKEIGVGKNGHLMWLCKCDCGREFEAVAAHIKNNTRKNCGKHRLERTDDIKRSINMVTNKTSKTLHKSLDRLIKDNGGFSTIWTVGENMSYHLSLVPVSNTKKWWEFWK